MRKKSKTCCVSPVSFCSPRIVRRFERINGRGVSRVAQRHKKCGLKRVVCVSLSVGYTGRPDVGESVSVKNSGKQTPTPLTSWNVVFDAERLTAFPVPRRLTRDE